MLRLAWIALWIGQWLYYGPRLPARVATHFGPSGRGDAFGSSTQLFVAMAVAFGFAASIGVLGRLIMHRTPTELISLPNRAYWLAPERKEQALEKLARALLPFEHALLAFMIGVQQLVFLANLASPPVLSPWFVPLLVVFLCFTFGWTVWLYRSFRVPTSG